MHELVLAQIDAIVPTSADERAQWQDARDWARSGVPLWRVAKPATPPKHLVAYFPVVDGDHILLVDHKNARRWLPSGGHVEPGEDPRDTVVREVHEELGLQVARHEVPVPLMVSISHTVGLTSGHTDVSLWYPVHRPRHWPLQWDAGEFHGVRWFPFNAVPHGQTDPHLAHFLAKLQQARAAATTTPTATATGLAPSGQAGPSGLLGLSGPSGPPGQRTGP